MEYCFSDVLKGHIIIVGIGNVLRGDDGAGPALVGRLDGNVKAVCIDAGTSPESYTGTIVKERADTILLVDVVHLGRPAGEFALMDQSEIVKSGFTTHDISPKMFIEYLENRTNATIFMLGIQPQNLKLGEEISAPVQKALDEVEKKIKETIGA